MTTTSPPPAITDLLSLLRSVESAPEVRDMAWSEHCTRQQAVILRLQSRDGRFTDIADLATVTGIPIDLVPDIPVAGTAFPTKDGWRIHLSAALNKAAQLRVALHELKHVLDHPLRIHPSHHGLQDADYEQLADYFADCVLAEDRP
ncbi:ImmA/IrrE family metallo-endopeptidase [Janibacter sp. YAF2_2]